MAGVFDSFLQGQQAGQEQLTKRTLSEYLQPALGGDQAALAKVYSASPDAGLQVQGLAQKQSAADHEQKLGQLELVAKAWRAADPTMRQQLYPSIAELTESVLPQFAGKIPREYNPQYEANIDKFLSGFAPVEDNTPAAIRELQILQANPQLAELDMKRRTAGFDRPQLIQTDSGYAWATPQGASPLNYGGQGESAPAIDQSAVQRNLAMLGAGNGVQMTSGLRTPERNAAVGGVANSQHLRGTAGDYVVPEAQKPQFRQEAEAMGFEVIDEGDHMHVQKRRGGGSRVMPAQKADSGAYSTLSADEVAGMGLPAGTVAQRSPAGQVQIVNKPRDLPTGGQVIDNGDGTTTYIPAGKVSEGERNASGFYSRMLESNAEMKRLESGGYDPTNRRDYYTAGGEILNPLASDEGQQYRQAQNNWVRANLRKESGAAIGKDEMEQERRNYFPIPGDSADVIKQKARAREVTERAMRQAAGGAVAPPGKQQPKSGGSEIDSLLGKYGVR